MIHACGLKVEVYYADSKDPKNQFKKDRYNVLFAAGGPFATGVVCCVKNFTWKLK